LEDWVSQRWAVEALTPNFALTDDYSDWRWRYTSELQQFDVRGFWPGPLPRRSTS
jgi:hypothetical protein